MKKRLSALLCLLLLFSCGENNTKDLNVSIRGNDYMVEITNNDLFDYQNAELELNGEYKIENVNIKAGETYYASLSSFVNDDYYKFNSSTMERKKFTIYCDLPDGSKGFFYGEND